MSIIVGQKTFSRTAYKTFVGSAAIAAVMGLASPAAAQGVGGCANAADVIVALFAGEAAGNLPPGTAAGMTSYLAAICASPNAPPDANAVLCQGQATIVSPTSSGICQSNGLS